LKACNILKAAASKATAFLNGRVYCPLAVPTFDENNG